MKARRIKGLEAGAPLRPNAARIVETRLAEMLALSGPAQDPAASRAQHDLRIAAKRLRYVLEIAGPCIGPEAEAARTAAKELQGLLGEIHDCDVMLPSAAGIESLEILLRTRRELLLRRFQEFWASESERGTWRDLELAL